MIAFHAHVIYDRLLFCLLLFGFREDTAQRMENRCAIHVYLERNTLE